MCDGMWFLMILIETLLFEVKIKIVRFCTPRFEVFSIRFLGLLDCRYRPV